jgi:hypothetical protein
MGQGLRYSPLEWNKDKRTFTMGGGDMVAGVGITSGTGTICVHSVTRMDGIFKTEILIDLTGLNGCGTADDIIGVDGGTVNCHIGQITTAVNGRIFAGKIECHEAPAGGNADIDLYSATEPSGVQDAAITTLVETALCDAGAHSAGSTDVLTAWPADGEYLYLVAGTATDADFKT